MAKFPSEEWVKQYVEKLNSNPDYEDAARNWEGDITFVVKGDERFAGEAYLYLDLYHGKCRGVAYAFNDSSGLKKSEFRYIGTYSNWVRLLKGEIDPIQGVLMGKFRLEGPMVKVMRYTRAAKELVRTAAMVPTEW